MFAKHIAPDSGLQQLRDEGLEVEVRQQHLLVHAVPYVTTDRQVAKGVLVCKYIENAGAILAPAPPNDNHQVWWIGSFPCRSDGTPLTDLVGDIQPQSFTIFEKIIAQHQFSNKPHVWKDNFPDHYEKMIHYVTLIESQARGLDKDANARTGRIVEPKEDDSVFRYADTASVRAEIVANTDLLKGKKIAIVGVGGTGSYILDQVTKTPVEEIHLFDNDEFKQHNAFRAPGAATREDIARKMKKVEYFQRRYEPMRRGIIPHPYHIDEVNVAELAEFDFVFICVDKGPARRTVSRFLAAKMISFVDVGMDVVVNEKTKKLDGSCRVTAGSAEKQDHLSRCLPIDNDESDALYRKNIQISDLNALNAQLAIIKWKQLVGFYDDFYADNQLVFSVSTTSLARAEPTRK